MGTPCPSPLPSDLPSWAFPGEDRPPLASVTRPSDVPFEFV